jgi:hypothetical protein
MQYIFIRSNRQVKIGQEVAVITDTGEGGRVRLWLWKGRYLQPAGGMGTPEYTFGLPHEEAARQTVLGRWHRELGDSKYVPYDATLHGLIDQGWLAGAAQ